MELPPFIYTMSEAEHKKRAVDALFCGRSAFWNYWIPLLIIIVVFLFNQIFYLLRSESGSAEQIIYSGILFTLAFLIVVGLSHFSHVSWVRRNIKKQLQDPLSFVKAGTFKMKFLADCIEESVDGALTHKCRWADVECFEIRPLECALRHKYEGKDFDFIIPHTKAENKVRSDEILEYVRAKASEFNIKEGWLMENKNSSGNTYSEFISVAIKTGLSFLIVFFIVDYGIRYFYSSGESSVHSYLESESNLKIELQRIKVLDDDVIILGKIKNGDNISWNHVSFSAEVFAEDGSLLDLCDGYLYNSIAPDETRHFKIECEHILEEEKELIKSFEVRITHALSY